jgi:hypothetical protein
MLEAAWGRRDRISRFFEARDYTVGTYDRRSDAFTADIGTAHRNWFAVPTEKLLAITKQT